mgnify:CR=1 FL=1
MIRISQLHYQYSTGVSALMGIDLDVKEGERIALIGPNGAGKSTLLLHLNGILQGQGLIEVDGLEVSKTNLPQIRARVGMVFQNPDDQLFSLTVGEDVAYGPKYMGLPQEQIEHRVIAALEAVGLQGFEHRHPFHLSGGEKKKASIATVLSMNPNYLVMDEPTAGLDPRARRELIVLLKNLPHSLILATHDLPMVSDLAQRVIVLNHGKIIADGTSEKILSDSKLLLENGLM